MEILIILQITTFLGMYINSATILHLKQYPSQDFTTLLAL